MPQSDGVRADIEGLLDLAGSVTSVGDDVAEVVGSLAEVPPPRVDGYGWQATVDAMETVLDSWSNEVDLVRRACQQIGDNLSMAAESLVRTDGANADGLWTYE